MVDYTVQRSFYEPTQDRGYWSPSTSTANFCEEDYVVSHYIGEFVNTLTNLAYVYYALYPPQGRLKLLTSSTRQKDEVIWALRKSSQPRTRYDLQFAALILVGVSSGIFHASLHMLPQSFDESSMYLLAASWIHALLTTSYVPSRGIKSTESRHQLLYHITRNYQSQTWLVIAASLGLATLISSYTGHLAIHSIIFALLLVLTGIKLIYLIILATPSANSPSGLTYQNVFSLSPARRILFTSQIRALLFLLLAFSLWLIDCNPEYCAKLRYLRNEVLGPTWYLRPLVYATELHGWWHILTARAAGEYMVLVRLLTTDT